MSRSRRQTPIWGIAAPRDSAKWEKRHSNRCERVALRGHLAHERWDEARWRETSPGDIHWDGPKEYRHYSSPYDCVTCDACRDKTWREQTNPTTKDRWGRYRRQCYCFTPERFRAALRK